MASKKDKKIASILSKYFSDSEKSDLINMLTYHEGGFYSVAYMDSKDIPTAGVGINLSNVQNLTKKQKAGQESIDAKRLQKLFIKRLNRSTSDAISFVGGTKAFRKLSTTRKSILVQMAFNLGLTKLNGFKRFKTYTRAAIAAKGKKEELGLWSNAQMEMIDSDWHNDVGMRALDFEKSFLDDNYYISDELQTSQTLLDLASKKNAIAAEHDAEELRKWTLPELEVDPLDAVKKSLKEDSSKDALVRQQSYMSKRARLDKEIFEKFGRPIDFTVMPSKNRHKSAYTGALASSATDFIGNLKLLPSRLLSINPDVPNK